MDRMHEQSIGRCAAVLAMATALLVGVVLMLTIGPANDQGQIVRMYACLACTLLLALAACRLLCALWQKKEGLCRALTRDLPEKAISDIMVAAVLCCAWLLQLLPGDGMCIRTVYMLPLVAFYIALRRSGFLKQQASRPLIMALGAFLCVQAIVYTYTPALVNCNMYTWHHYTAVVHSLYNVSFNTPYTMRTSGVYGHYAIFFWPLLKLFGHSPQTVSVLMTGCNILMLLLLLAAGIKMTRNTGLLLLLTLTLAACVSADQVYLALWPLRILWPAAILVWLLYRPKTLRAGAAAVYDGLGYLLCGLALTWNTDSGLVAIVAYTLCIWLAHWRQTSPLSRKMARVYVGTGLGCAASVGIFLGIVNIYNFLCGGPFVLRACFYPLLGGEGYTQALQGSLNEVVRSWLIPCCVFAVATAGGVFTTSLCKISDADANIQTAFCGIMGQGQCYYFFNRSYAGWSNVLPYVGLCLVGLAQGELCLPAETGRKPLYPTARRAAARCAQCLLCVFGMCFLLQFPALWAGRIESKRNSMDSMEELARQVQENVPMDTYAFGYLVQDIYAFLGWDPGYHQRDCSDLELTSETGQMEIADMKAQDAVLINKKYFEILLGEHELLPEKAIMVEEDDGGTLYYCTRNVPPIAAFDFEHSDPESLPAIYAHLDGFDYEAENQRYWLMNSGKLIMNADTLKQNGLEMELEAPKHRLADNGRTSAVITLWVEGEPVAKLELTREEEKEDRQTESTTLRSHRKP